METIKVIDLLNLVYENKAPKKIKISDGSLIRYYKYDHYEKWYQTLDKTTLLNVNYADNLSVEVEIIEENPKEIEPWGDLPLEELKEKNLNIRAIQIYLRTTINTQNEIIKAVNYLLKKEDE